MVDEPITPVTPGQLREVLDRLETVADKIPGEIRLGITKRAAQNFGARKLSPEDMDVALSMFRILARDVEVEIRQVLAETLKADPMLPHDLAINMARDVTEVSGPILQFSPVLDDQDLMQMLSENPSVAAQLAIASRAQVSEPISYALIEQGSRDVAERVANNQGAVLSDRALIRAIERFPDAETALSKMVERHTLPADVAEKLASRVSIRLRAEIMAKSGKVAPSRVDDAIASTEEWARLTIVNRAGGKELEQFVHELHREHKLTPSLLLRALCWGNVSFFETAMAVRGNVTQTNARQLLQDQGPLGFKAIYRAANMPAGMADALKILFNLAMEANRNREEPARFPEALLEGIMRGGYQQTVDNMPYVVALLGHNIRTGMQG